MKKTLAVVLFLLLWAAPAPADEVKIVVEGRGRVAVPAAEVLAAQDLPSAELDSVAVLARGREIPFAALGGEDGRLDPGDTIFFDSEGSGSWHTRRAAFFVRFGGAPGPRVAPEALGQGEDGAKDRIVRAVEEKDLERASFEECLLPIRANPDRWFWFGVGANSDRAVEIELPGKPAGPARVRVHLAGEARTGERASAECLVAGKVAGKVSLAPVERSVVEAEVPLTSLAGGKLSVGLRSLDAAWTSRVWLDRIELEYTAGEPVAPRILAPVRIAPRRGADLREPAEGADYVMLVPDPFREALGPLVEHRRKLGHRVRLVSPEEAYDAFGDGECSPEAIQRFLAHARANWPEPRLEYVLLAADATWDVDWMAANTIPTWIVETFLNGESGSDNPYADTDGDHLPDLALGRFPARSVEELAGMVARTIRYETGDLPGEWRRRLSFVTSEGRFGRGPDKLMEVVFTRLVTDRIPDPYDVNVTYANPDSPYLYVPRRFNDKVLERLNDGSLFFVYVGHGYAQGFDSLRWERERFPILTTDHLERVAVREGAPIVVVIACTTGQYDDPRKDSIGEGLLRHANGPVAFIGSTRVSHPYPNAILGKETIDVLFRETREPQTLGALLAEVKGRMCEAPRGDVLRLFIDGATQVFLPEGSASLERMKDDHAYLYNLLGDPALVVGTPRGGVSLSIQPRRASPGDELVVSGEVEGLPSGTGTVSVSLAAMRDRILEPLEEVRPGEPGADERIESNYARANKKEVARAAGKAESGRFEVRLRVPAPLPRGTYRVIAYVQGERGTAVGSARIRIED
ncbi:MAG: hypothetical protein HY720_26070 [Planctomycetes bacterium]|nr:hypothetical protein [Planctomycetota bacterium]